MNDIMPWWHGIAVGKSALPIDHAAIASLRLKCRRFEVPTPPAASSFRNFKSKSGTRIINLLVWRFRKPHHSFRGGRKQASLTKTNQNKKIFIFFSFQDPQRRWRRKKRNSGSGDQC